MSSHAIRRSRLAAWLRLCLFLGLVLGISAWWKVRQVSADVSELSASLGRGLSKLQRAAEGTTHLRLNGERFALTTVTTEASVAHVIERFSLGCARASGGLLEELRELERGGIAIPPEAATSLGVLRMISSDDEASAGCFVRSGGGGARDVLARAERAFASGDLAELGQLRYVFARRRAAEGPTHVLTLTALGRIPLASMFPEQVDAPGGDLLDGVRPPEVRRVLSARVEGSEQQLILYETTADAERSLDSYDAPLRARGFSAGDLSPADGLAQVPARVYFKRDDSIVLLAAPQDNGKTLVSSFHLAGGGFASMTVQPFE
jgi:hypothetical protein